MEAEHLCWLGRSDGEGLGGESLPRVPAIVLLQLTVSLAHGVPCCGSHLELCEKIA